MIRFFYFINIILFLNVSSCYSKIKVTYSINSNRNVIFYINSSSWLSSKHYIKDITVKDIKKNKVVWGVFSNDRCYLDKIIYGELPKRFTEIVKAKKLIKGKNYLISISGPGAGGGLDFIYK